MQFEEALAFVTSRTSLLYIKYAVKGTVHLKWKSCYNLFTFMSLQTTIAYFVHTKRDVRQNDSLSPFTFIVWKTDAVKVNGYCQSLNFAQPRFVFCKEKTHAGVKRHEG